MPNIDTPFGLRPVRYLNGAPWNGQVRSYLISSGDPTAVFIGDPVKLAGSAGTSGQMVTGIPAGGLATVIQAAAGNVCVGVVVGFAPLQTDLTVLHRLASTNRIAYVVDDPNVVFEIQEVSGGTALTADEVGLNVNFIVAAGITTTGVSQVELNNSGENTTDTLNCKILGLVQREDNDYGENAKWEVLLNAHAFRNGITGV